MGLTETLRNLHPLVQAFLASSFGWGMTALGAATVFMTKSVSRRLLDGMLGFAAGVMIAASFWTLLAPAIEMAKADSAPTWLPAGVGYSKGVPMGGDLTHAPNGKAPTFLVASLKDPMSGNLDRIQIIKGWLGSDGKAQERVYDVAVSDGRAIDKDGRCRQAVGNTVDVANATWTNTIGDVELITVWTDPDFDPKQHAFYYARVIEIPTPRWTAYEALRFNVEALDECPTGSGLAIDNQHATGVGNEDRRRDAADRQCTGHGLCHRTRQIDDLRCAERLRIEVGLSADNEHPTVR